MDRLCRMSFWQMSMFLVACWVFAAFVVVTAVNVGGCIPKNMTPQEKIEFSTLKGLETAKIFRDTALDAARDFWRQGLLSEEQAHEIAEVADDLQRAINEASYALEAYHKTGDLAESDIEAKAKAYHEIYVRFSNLVMPFILKE